MTSLIITILVTTGIIFIVGGVGLYIFTEWLENNEEGNQ